MTGMLPNTTPITQEVKQAAAMKPNRTPLVDDMPIRRWALRIAVKKIKIKLNTISLVLGYILKFALYTITVQRTYTLGKEEPQ